MIYEYKISADPRPAARPRVTRYGTYIPSLQKNLMLDIQDQLLKQNPVLLTDWVAIDIVCRFKRPVRQVSDYPPRCDVDNLAKLVLDSMQGIVLENDNKVQTLSVSKCYTYGNQKPGYSITVETMD